MKVRVVLAFFDSGGRKVGTPLEMASTPESTTAPEEKARSSTKMAALEVRACSRANSPASSGPVSMGPRSKANTRVRPITRREPSSTT